MLLPMSHSSWSLILSGCCGIWTLLRPEGGPWSWARHILESHDWWSRYHRKVRLGHDQYRTYKFGELGGPHQINTCDLSCLGSRRIHKGGLLWVIGHRTLGTKLNLVVINSRSDKFLGDIVIVLGVWTAFMLGEFLSLDSSYPLIFFLDRFPSPLGMDVTPISTEQTGVAKT